MMCCLMIWGTYLSVRYYDGVAATNYVWNNIACSTMFLLVTFLADDIVHTLVTGLFVWMVILRLCILFRVMICANYPYEQANISEIYWFNMTTLFFSAAKIGVAFLKKK